MKKVLLQILGTLLVIIVVIPFLGGNLEKEELNEQTRKQLDGEFIELSDGITHYEIKGEKGVLKIWLE